MVRLISRQRGGLAALKLTKFFGIDDFPAAKDSGKVLIIIIYCYLIIIFLGKSRVTPLKVVSIPRFELAGAVVAVKLNCLIQNKLKYSIQDTIYWTDSTVVCSTFPMNHDVTHLLQTKS